jgi:hypothetical protein
LNSSGAAGTRTFEPPPTNTRKSTTAELPTPTIISIRVSKAGTRIGARSISSSDPRPASKGIRRGPFMIVSSAKAAGPP